MFCFCLVVFFLINLYNISLCFFKTKCEHSQGREQGRSRHLVLLTYCGLKAQFGAPKAALLTARGCGAVGASLRSAPAYTSTEEARGGPTHTFPPPRTKERTVRRRGEITKRGDLLAHRRGGEAKRKVTLPTGGGQSLRVAGRPPPREEHSSTAPRRPRSPSQPWGRRGGAR